MTSPREETPERLRRAEGKFEDVLITDENNRQFLRREFFDNHILRWLASRGKIDAFQAAAGEQFYADWYASGLAASGVVDPCKEPVDGDPPRDLPESVWAAKQRYHRAVKAIDWLHLNILTSVVLSEESLESYGDRTQARWYAPGKRRTAAALTVLRTALTLLDNHYSPPRKSPPPRTSMAVDARPMNRPDLR